MFQQRGTFPQVLAAAALAGFGMGICWPAWQVALEPAQVLAQIVRYPIATPFQLYETQVWNVWHQLLAPLLAAGCSERGLTVVLSGVVTALGFAAVAGFARALGANAALALAAPLLVVLNHAQQPGFSYPIHFFGLGHTYGMGGLYWLALACGAIASERWRLAGFLLGLAPALHVSLGAWLAIAVTLAALPALPALRPHLRAFCAGATLGAALCAASLGAHIWLAPPAPPSDPASADRYLTAFVRLWDSHRAPADLGGRASFLVWCSVLTALALLRMERDRLGAGAALALRVLVVCGAVGFASSAAQALLSSEFLPTPLLIAMPARLANLVALLAVPLALAVVWRFRADPLPRALLLAASALLALELAEPVRWGDVELDTVGVPLLCATPLVALARNARRGAAIVLLPAGLLAWLVVRALWRGPSHPEWLIGPATLSLAAAALGFVGLWLALERSGAAQPLRRTTRALDAALGAGLAAIAVWVAGTSLADADARWQQLHDRTNHTVLAQAARGTGLLLVGPGLETVQLRTRRPLLLDPSALDMLPYVLRAGPEVETILREAYGVEFFRPPAEALAAGVLPEHPIRGIFERREASAWRALRVRFGVSEVLVRAEWRLRLPLVARGDGYALYALPE